MFKKALITICLVLLLAYNSFAAGSVAFVSVEKFPNTSTPSVIVLSYLCTSDASDGTLPAKAITVADATLNYYSQGYKMVDARTISHASTPPTTAVAVTLADSDGVQFIGSAIGETLTPSTSASGIGYFLVDRPSSQRTVTKLLTIGAIGSTIGNSKVYTLRIILSK
jgi:hypothetical protein